MSQQTKKAIFLDRDGVINKEKNHLHKIREFEFEKNALAGLKAINFDQFLVFLICNQAGVAKGIHTLADFQKLDRWLKNKLAKKNIRIKETYFCPHHPEAKIKKYRKKCHCRKPGPGMLLKAKKEFNLDLNHSFLIGDKTSDILAGKNAGCMTILVQTGYAGKDGLFKVNPDYTAEDLLSAIKLINSKKF